MPQEKHFPIIVCMLLFLEKRFCLHKGSRSGILHVDQPQALAYILNDVVYIVCFRFNQKIFGSLLNPNTLGRPVTLWPYNFTLRTPLPSAHSVSGKGKASTTSPLVEGTNK